MTPTPSKSQRAFDLIAAEHVLQRLSRQAQAPWLHTEVARRMAERLSLFRMQPQHVIEWWPTWGGSQDLLKKAYPQAQRWGVECDPAWLARAHRDHHTPWWRATPWSGKPVQWALQTHTDNVPRAELLWSNMMLHAVADPLALMARWHQLLEVDGCVMFSSLGPGSLPELRRLYQRKGWPAPHADLVDMHDLGDMLVETGFTNPVVDQETLTLTWSDPQAMLAELRQWGGNVSPHRYRALRTPRWLRQLHAELQPHAQTPTPISEASRVCLTIEVAYGHAFKAPQRVPVLPETSLSAQTLQSMARRARTTQGE